MKFGYLASTRAGIWSLASAKLHPPHPLFPPLDHSCILTKYQQVLLDNNYEIFYYLPGFCTAIGCGLAIETPVPPEDHIDKDPRNTHLNNWRRQQFSCSL